MKRFLMITKARLRKRFPFKKQRDAIAAKMYIKYIERKKNAFDNNFDINHNSVKTK